MPGPAVSILRGLIKCISQPQAETIILLVSFPRCLVLGSTTLLWAKQLISLASRCNKFQGETEITVV